MLLLRIRLVRVVLLLLLMLLAPQRAAAEEDEPLPGTGSGSFTDLRDQGIHYLKMGKRALALKSLEKSLQLGGSNDEKLILVLARLHQEEGNLGRAFDVLAEGPETPRIGEFKTQLSSQYATVVLQPVEGKPREGWVSLLPDEPIINPERKAYFQTLLDRGPLAARIKLPQELILPTGGYRVNGRPLTAVAGGKTIVEVPFFEVAVLVGRGRGKEGRATAARLERELGTASMRLVELDEAEGSRGVTALATREPALLVTVGEDALERAYKDLRSLPLVALGVEQTEGGRLVRRHGAATAIWSDLPRRRLFERMRELLPGVGRVGVVLNREHSWVAYESVLADRPDEVRFVPALVTSKGGVASNLLRLRPLIDALWILPDPQLFDARAIQLIATWSYREKIPVLVEQVALVQQGALLAAEVRWDDILGAGLAFARRVLWEEQAPNGIEPSGVGEPSWGLNTSVASHLGVDLPAGLLDELRVKAEQTPPLAGASGGAGAAKRTD